MNTKQLHEQITIKAGEMSWEEWQGHLNRILPRDLDEISRPLTSACKDGCRLGIVQLLMKDTFPITFKKDFTYTPVYHLTDLRKLEGGSEGIDDLEALANEPLKHYVWVEGMQPPSKPHDTREDALKEALRLSPKERNGTFEWPVGSKHVYLADKVYKVMENCYGIDFELLIDGSAYDYNSFDEVMEAKQSFYHAQRDAQLKANAPTTDRWLDVRDAIATMSHELGFMGEVLVLYKDGSKHFETPTTFSDYSQMISDDAVAFKCGSWIDDPKSPEAQADAKRFAGVKTWEGGEDE
jgi:hypothetical protein